MNISKQTLHTVVNKQFEMIGVDLRLENIPEDSLIVNGKKRELWYEVYTFETEEQYKEWRTWAEKLIPGWKDMLYIDLRYGMTYRYKKKGEC